jgi:hypothetical protein
MFFSNLISKLTTEKGDTSKTIDVPVTSIVPAFFKLETSLFVYQESFATTSTTFVKEFETKRPDDEIQTKFDKMKGLIDALGQHLIPECNKKFEENQEEIFARTRESIEKLGIFFKEAEIRKVSYSTKAKAHDGEIGKKIIEMENYFEGEASRMDEELAEKLENIKNEYTIE